MNQLIVDNVIINTPLIDIINTIKTQLTNGKLRDIDVRGDDIRVTCPSHKSGLENKPSCNIYIGKNKSGLFYGCYNCFTCGSKGPFWHFVAECFDVSDYIAKKWLIENFGENKLDNIVQLEEIKLNNNTKSNYIDESILDKFQSYHPYMDYRKLNRATCEKFKIKYDPTTNCIVFPVWDIKGNLSFLTRRSVNSKLFIIDKNADKSNIYLLNYIAKEDIDTVVVCEGQINALTCWQNGLPAIALLGAATTDEQMDIINKTSIKHFILAYDEDNAGLKGRRRFHKLIRKDVFVDDVYMPFGKDINDLTISEFNLLFNKFINK